MGFDSLIKGEKMKRKITFFLLFSVAFLFLCAAISYAYRCGVVHLSSPRPAQRFVTGPLRPTFSWEAVEGAIKYHIQVSEYEQPSDGVWHRCVVDESEVESTSYQLAFELPVKEGPYYWHVRAMIYPDERGTQRLCPWSERLTFQVWPPPKTSELINPPNSSHIDYLRPEFQWRDPEQYGRHDDQIQVATDSSFRNIVFDRDIPDTRGTHTYLSPIDLEYSRTYYWRVRFKRIWPEIEGLTMPGEWSAVSSFETYLPLLPKVFLISPAYGGHVSSSATFNWNPIPTATEYILIISDNEDFSNIILRLFPTTNSITVPLRFADGTYYWHVRARNASGYGEWSDARSFIKTSRLPEPVVLQEPENGVVLHSAAPLFGWEGRTGTGLGNFHLQVSSASNFATTVIDKDNIPEDSSRISSPVNLFSGVTYYWRMRRQNVAGWGGWSEVRNFRIDLSSVSSARVDLSSPGNTTSTDRVRVDFCWRSVPSRCLRYHLQVSNNSNFTDIFSEALPTGICQFIFLEGGRTYYWRVRAEDEVGWGQWSDVWTVTVSSTGLIGPTLHNPKGPVATSRPEFSWRGFAEMSGRDPVYNLQVSTNPDISSPIIDRHDIRQTTYTPSIDLVSGYRYYWRARGKERSDAAWWPWSTIECFWITSIVTPVILVSPEDNAALRTTRPRFSWNAELPYGSEEFEIEAADRRDFSTFLFRNSVPPSGPISGGRGTISFLSPHNLSEGTYFWHVRQKIGEEGSWGTWCDARSFKVDVTAPLIRVVYPTQEEISSSTIPARVNVSCEVTDNLTGVEKVEFYLAGRRVAERNRPYEDSTYVAEITGLNEGRNNIVIKAYDKSGRTGNVAQTSFTLEVKRVMGIKRPAIIPKKAKTPRKTLPKDKLPPKPSGRPQ